MKEDLLHFIWKYQLFEHNQIYTTEGQEITILKTGTHNHNSGPDFMDSRVKIDDTIWAGNIEIHIKSTDWFAHNHQNDPAYKNVILHVVYENDFNKDNSFSSNIPILELKEYIETNLFSSYEELMKSQLWIPCSDSLNLVDRITKNMWLERMVIEKLEKRYELIKTILQRNNYDWIESFHQYFAHWFGFKVNNEAFENLALITPFKLIAKIKDNNFKVEALLYGQSGLLSDSYKDTYPQHLLKEYQFIQKKYSLTPMEPNWWQFSRLRPLNFPTIRIAQYADFLFKSYLVISDLLEINNTKQFIDYFKIGTSEYWTHHYIFDKNTPNKISGKLGKSSVNNLLINAAIPFLFAYGMEKNNQKYINKAISFLEEIPPENNSILKKWQDIGFRNKMAFDSQALLFLKKEYCNYKKCLDCSIGVKILKSAVNI